jgi:hypothetical protein
MTVLYQFPLPWNMSLKLTQRSSRMDGYWTQQAVFYVAKAFVVWVSFGSPRTHEYTPHRQRGRSERTL